MNKNLTLRGFQAHTGDMLPCDRNTRVDVMIDCQQEFDVLADDVDWGDVMYWRPTQRD